MSSSRTSAVKFLALFASDSQVHAVKQADDEWTLWKSFVHVLCIDDLLLLIAGYQQVIVQLARFHSITCPAGTAVHSVILSKAMA